MRFTLILLLSVFCFVNFVISEENDHSPKPTNPSKRPNPFILLQLMPTLLEKLRERFPRGNIEVLFPMVFKEIQDTMQLPQFSGLDSPAMPALISTIIERMVQRLQSRHPQSPVPSSTEQAAIIREMKTRKPEIISTQTAALSEQTTSLPDLAFDRDPSRNIPRIDSEDDDELGIEPEKKHEKPASLGEYDEFYKQEQ